MVILAETVLFVKTVLFANTVHFAKAVLFVERSIKDFNKSIKFIKIRIDYLRTMMVKEV